MIEFDEAARQSRIDGVAMPSVTQLVAPLREDCDEPEDGALPVVFGKVKKVYENRAGRPFELKEDEPNAAD